jgi:Tfp pilus assembly protein PilW
MSNTGRTVLSRGFSIVEAMIALGLVLLALVSVFDVMPFTYNAIGEDAIRSEAATSAHRYLDDVRVAIEAGQPLPPPMIEPLSAGSSMATGQASQSTPSVALVPLCTQPEGASSPLFDCKISVIVTVGGETHTLAPLETLITRQLP